MATYARISGNTVVELFTPPAGTTIAQCFHSALQWIRCDNTPGVQPGWTATASGNIWTFAPPTAAPGPTLAQQAMALLASGIAVTSSATPALNGTYAVDDNSRADVVAIETSLNAGKGFPPSGASTFAYPDMTGQFHTFAAADFTNLAAAMRDFVYACKAAANGGLAVLPSAAVTIP